MEGNPQIRALVVDDDPEDVMILRLHLDRVAHLSVSVDHIADWRRQDVDTGRFDIVFLDYRLGEGLTGLDVLKEIRVKDGQVPVVVLTGAGDEQVAVEIMKAGAADYIVKDSLSPELLEKTMHHVIGDRIVAEEKARLDAALRESERRYRTLVNTLTEYLYSVKIEAGQALPVLHSPACLRVTGYSPEEYQKNPNLWLEMVFLEDRPRVLEHFRCLTEGKAVEPIEHRILRKDGAVRWVRNSPAPHFDQAEQVAGYDGLIADITERREAEEALRASEGKLNAMLQSIGDLMIMMDRDLNVLWANDTARKLFGADILGKKCYEVYHGGKEPRGLHDCLAMKAFQDGRTHEEETQVADQDGNAVYLHCIANVALRNEDGTPTAVMEIARDITGRKRTQREIAAKNQQLEDANRKLAEQAQVDELTGLVNRRRFYELLADEAERIRRYPMPLSLVMCDIDHFKQINDTCGHICGDQVLREVAAKLDAGSRGVDTVARYGGEEFMIIMPGTASDNAVQAAERLRALLAQAVITNGVHQVKVTLSFGVAGVTPGQGGTVDSLVGLADEALYAAKRAGRNCTVRWEDISEKRASTQVATTEQVQVLQEELASLSVKSQEALFQAILGLAQAQEARDPYLAGHSRNVARCAVAIAKHMGLNDKRIENLRRAAMLHDIGKIGIPDKILHKPGPLDDEERAIIQQHPLTSVRILEGMTFLGPLLPFIRHHHERWDGGGYPDGLAGEAIPVEARILAVADAFDAITSDRPYRKARPVQQALQVMRDGAGTQFDAHILAVFEEWVGQTVGEGVPVTSESAGSGPGAAEK